MLIVAVMFAGVFIEQVAIKKHEDRLKKIHYGKLVIKELRNGQLASFGPYHYAHNQFLKEKKVVEEAEVIHYAYSYYLGEV